MKSSFWITTACALLLVACGGETQSTAPMTSSQEAVVGENQVLKPDEQTHAKLVSASEVVEPVEVEAPEEVQKALASLGKVCREYMALEEKHIQTLNGEEQKDEIADFEEWKKGLSLQAPNTREETCRNNLEELKEFLEDTQRKALESVGEVESASAVVFDDENKAN